MKNERSAVAHAWVAYLCSVESDAIYYAPEGATPEERDEANRLADMGDAAFERAKARTADPDGLWRRAVDAFRGEP